MANNLPQEALPAEELQFGEQPASQFDPEMGEPIEGQPLEGQPADAGAELSEYQQTLLAKYKSGEFMTTSEKMDLIGDPRQFIQDVKKRQTEAEIFYNVGPKDGAEIMNLDITLAHKLALSKLRMAPSARSLDAGYFKYEKDRDYWDPTSEKYGSADDDFELEFRSAAMTGSKTDRNLFMQHYSNLKNRSVKEEIHRRKLNVSQAKTVMFFENGRDKISAMSEHINDLVKSEGLAPHDNAIINVQLQIISSEFNKDLGSITENEFTVRPGSGSVKKVDDALNLLSRYMDFPKGNGWFDSEGSWVTVAMAEEDPRKKETTWVKYMMRDYLNVKKTLRKVVMPEEKPKEEDYQEIGGFKVYTVPD